MFSDREREWISRKTAELARDIPPPSAIINLAKKYSTDRISALRYDPADRVYRYRDMVTGDKKEVPESLIQERVAMVCRRDDGTLEVKPIETLPGQLGARVQKSACYPDQAVGVIHTHPAGAAFPSPEDLLVESDPDIAVMCVGSKQGSGSSAVYPVMCFYKYPWVDKSDIRSVVNHLSRKLDSFISSPILSKFLRLDIYDAHGIRFVYIFPPPLASRYLMQELKRDPVISSVYDIDYRVWDTSDLSP